VYGIGLRLLGDRGLAEDVVQETFIRLWRAAPRFDPARGTVRTFVFTIARRTAVDFARRGSSRPAGIGMDHASLEREAGADPRSGEEFDALLLGLELREAMSELSDSHREVLELSFDSDLSQAQIAQRLAVPLGTVKTRTYYGLKALRAVIEERGLL
jgi:RNA polymerase sigma-70 factor (ECF subfamily)